MYGYLMIAIYQAEPAAASPVATQNKLIPKLPRTVLSQPQLTHLPDRDISRIHSTRVAFKITGPMKSPHPRFRDLQLRRRPRSHPVLGNTTPAC